jgi:two-component system sensor histidine kinase KdpD
LEEDTPDMPPTSDRRPDPDALLQRVREEELSTARGKLTIFFGAAPGVGKTYTMLEAARVELGEHRPDVVVGIVETHGRYDTGSLLIGLEILPRRSIEHRGIRVDEFDLDAALRRKPALILIDELAHTNEDGSRHPKRWQDVEELLASGIDVFTTLNVQHLESLNDVVAQITGVIVRETVPDSVFDNANEVRVIDLPVAELLERLREGKVYRAQQAEHAASNFFKEGNLIALRELALRRTAERVEAQARGYKAAHGIDQTWRTAERVLVCVSPSPSSAQLIRAARRLASSLHAPWIAAYVETPGTRRLSAPDRERLATHMRLAETLGAEAVFVRGERAAEELVRFAKAQHVTKLIVGKPTHARWRDMLSRSFLDDVVRLSGEIDVHAISRDIGGAARAAGAARPPERRRPNPRGYIIALGAVVASTAISAVAFGPARETDIVMIYLLGIVIVSMRVGFGAAMAAAVASVLSFDFFFIPPYYSFAVTDFQNIVTFVVMFLVAGILSHLTTRIREQADDARSRERTTASLYSIARELALARTLDSLLSVAARHVREVFDASVAVLLPTDGAGLGVAYSDASALRDDERELGLAEWAWLHQQPAGVGTDTLPSGRAFMMPLAGSRGRVGILALVPRGDPNRLRDTEERRLLETFAGIIGSAIERAQLADEARKSRLRAETEQVRNSLLSSVSHDLRTPLAVITGAAATLLDPAAPTDPGERRELLQTIHEEGQRLNRLVRNLLDMTRLDAGAVLVNKELQPIEEVIGSALNRMMESLRGREIRTHVPSDLPLVPLDAILIEQVLVNLLENAAKHTPGGTPIDVGATARADAIEVEVADRGPGVAPEDTARVFEKFYRAGSTPGGVGLGLTICAGVVHAHGGRIWVEARPGGGASFRFTLPLGTTPSS